MAYRVVCYINQFFAGMGGEDTAHVPPEFRPEAVGPAAQLDTLFGDDATVVGTVICGDSYYGEHMDEAREKCLGFMKECNPDMVIAGPAFNAGRYGVACGDVAAGAAEELGVLTLTGMFEENPGLEMYGHKTYVVKTADSARGMRKSLPAMAALALKLLRKEPMGAAEDEGYFSRGIRKNFFNEENGAQRGVRMLLQKLAGEPFTTEYEMPVFNKIPPAAPVADLTQATIALCTSGGIVPFGNPDKIRVSSAEKFGIYDVDALEDLDASNYESIHGGYDRAWANEDPDVVLPLDMMRQMEKEGRFKKLHSKIFCTTGTGTAVANAERFGQEIGQQLKDAGVDAAILTAT